MQKNRKTIVLLGENTSQPDLTVPDGTCEEISNLRFRNGSWQSVGHLQGMAGADGKDNYPPYLLCTHEVDGTKTNIYSVVRSHPTDNLNQWAIGYFDEDDYFQIIYEVDNYHPNVNIPYKDIKAFAYGRMIIISRNNMLTYIIRDKNNYLPFSMPTPVQIKEKRVNISSPVYLSEDANYDYIKLMDYDSKEILLTTSSGNGWVGEICYLVAYKMVDGTIISPSNLRIFCTEEIDDNKADLRIMRIPHYADGLLEKSAYSLVAKRKSGNYAKHFSFSFPTLRITIPNGVDISLVDRVCLFSTRINSFIDFDKLSKTVLSVTKDAEGSFSDSKYFLNDIYADNELPNQPMYLVAEASIKDINDGNWDIDLNYPTMSNIASNVSVYKAPQIHNIFAESLYDYNSRLHLANISSILYSHHSSLIPEISQNGLFQESVQFDDLGKNVFSQPITQPSFANEAEENTYPIEYPTGQWRLSVNGNIISYPDFRASSITIFSNSVHDPEVSNKIILRSAPANNFAYYIAPSGDLKYPFTEFGVDYSISQPPIEDNILSEPNRIQVSAPNNPFSLPFENSYKVGNESTHILAINSVADSLVESNFYGSYPLYIFTSDGTFALSAGTGEVLYGSTDIVNHDIITNPRTLAVNGAVIYADSEGIKALSGRSSALISAYIETPSTLSNKWADASFAFCAPFNELLVANNGVLHIFSLTNKVWSRRSLPTNALNAYFVGETLAAEYSSYTNIFDVNKESVNDIAIKIVTRPIKFDTQSFKGLATLVARWMADSPASVTIYVESSLDCVTWNTLSTASFVTNKQFGLRMRPASARFFRIRIEGEVPSHSTLLALDADVIYKYNKNLI